MNLRLMALAAFCRELAIPALVLAWLAVFGSAGIDHTRAAAIVSRVAPSLTADANFADKVQPILQPIAFGNPEVMTPGRSVMQPVDADVVPAVQEPDPIVTAALTDSSETLRPETPPEQATEPTMATREPASANQAPGDTSHAIGSTEVLDECFVVDLCVDRYLWALYQRTPKEDSVKEKEQRQVTVKRKGKLVTVTRNITKLVDENFSWKDPKAAEKAGMPLVDYVIGGMDRDFKLKLFHMLHAAEEAGLSPGITSAFRDDYRQSIASGLKAANERSYHGGSLRGGYGHGLAADIVSVNGGTRTQRLASTETFWKWVDAHGKEFGIGRPYLGRDPPHVGPIDGQEYVSRRPGTKTRQVVSAAKQGHGPALRDVGSTGKRERTARSSRVRTI